MKKAIIIKIISQYLLHHQNKTLTEYNKKQIIQPHRYMQITYLKPLNESLLSTSCLR